MTRDGRARPFHQRQTKSELERARELTKLGFLPLTRRFSSNRRPGQQLLAYSSLPLTWQPSSSTLQKRLRRRLAFEPPLFAFSSLESSNGTIHGYSKPSFLFQPTRLQQAPPSTAVPRLVQPSSATRTSTMLTRSHSPTSPAFGFDDQHFTFTKDAAHVADNEPVLPPSPPLAASASFRAAGSSGSGSARSPSFAPSRLSQEAVAAEHAALSEFSPLFGDLDEGAPSASLPPHLSPALFSPANHTSSPFGVSFGQGADFAPTFAPVQINPSSSSSLDGGEYWLAWEGVQEALGLDSGADSLLSMTLAGAPFDLAHYVHHEHATLAAAQKAPPPTTEPSPFSLAAFPFPLSSAAPHSSFILPGDMQTRAIGFNAALESPLDFDLDSPFGSSSEYTPSPWEAALGTPSLDYSPLFDTSAAHSTTSLQAVFPELKLYPDITTGGPAQARQQSHGAGPLFASPLVSPATRDVGLAPAPSAEEQNPARQPVEELVDEEATPMASSAGDDDEDYTPSSSTTSHSTTRTATRKRKPTGAGVRDPSTGKRVFNGVRTHDTVPIVPLEAPIQPRKWRGESRTSRKVLPKAIAKTISSQRRRNTSVGINDDEADEIDDDVKQEVDEKRKQNTLAARKSRQRKAEYLSGLEERVKEQDEQLEQLRQENEELRSRARAAGVEL